MKLNEIVNAGDAITKILEKEIPFKAAFKLSCLHKKLLPELESFEAQRKKILEKYGTQEGDTITIVKDNIEVFNTSLSYLLNMDVSVPEISKLSMDDLSGIPTLEGKYVYALYSFMETETA
jgi:hypothetical protein